jgi:hypothetical protein
MLTHLVGALNESSDILAVSLLRFLVASLLTIMIFSVLVNSMPDGRTGSKMT